MIRLRKDGIRWELVPGFAPLLDAALGSSTQVIKQSPAKVVAACSVGPGKYFIKRYLNSWVAFRPLKFLFKSSQARKEWNLAKTLELLKVPIVKHLALGERWGWRGLKESILITESFSGQPLDAAAGFSPQAVLDFVNRLHQCGVLQHDLHPGNILVDLASGEMRLVDLHGIQVKPLLTPAERNANLAFLRIFLPIPVSTEVIAQSERLRKDHYAQRARRCLRHNREFGPKRAGAWKWQVRLPFQNQAVNSVLEDPDGFLATHAQILKPGRSSTVGKANKLVLKRYNLRKWENLGKDLLRPSKARRAFKRAYHLELVGLPTARSIATTDKRRLRLLLRSYFLMEEIPGATDLAHWQGDRYRGTRLLAELIAAMHNEGFRHRDLKETNIVFDSQNRIYLLDLDGLEFVRTVSHAQAWADLNRLAKGAKKNPQWSRLLVLNFIRSYCRLRRLPPAAFLPREER